MYRRSSDAHYADISGVGERSLRKFVLGPPAYVLMGGDSRGRLDSSECPQIKTIELPHPLMSKASEVH